MDRYVPYLIIASWIFGVYFILKLIGLLFQPRSRIQKPATNVATKTIDKARQSFEHSSRIACLVITSSSFFLGFLVLFPVAMAFHNWVQLGLVKQAIFKIAVFLAVLCVALGYLWKKGDLNWVRDREKTRCDR